MSKGASKSDEAQLDLFTDVRKLSNAAPSSKAEKPGHRSTVYPVNLSKGTCYLSIEEVAKRYGVGKSTVWRWAASDKAFPKPIELSKGTSRWLSDQLLEFEKHAVFRTAANKSVAAEGRSGNSEKDPSP